MGFLEDYGIDAYEFLGIPDLCQDKKTIKTAYKSKSLVLHPDKTMGKTEVEFKILCKCYKYAIRNIVNEQAGHDMLRKDFEIEKKHQESNPKTPVNKLHLFETDRDFLFHDDTLDKNFENTINRMSKLSTAYSPIDAYDCKFKEQMSKDGRFNREKFNAIFSEIKRIRPSDQLTKYTGPVASNEMKVFTSVHTNHDGMILNSVDEPETNRESQISQKEIDRLLELDSKKIDALIKKNKKDTGKISRKKFKTEVTNRTLNKPKITETRTFSEMEKILEANILKNHKKDNYSQAKYVDTHKIYRFIE